MAILSVELLTFTFSVWAMMTLKKKKFPEIFFPPSGVVVFRPPEEEDIKGIRESKEQKTKNLNKYKKQLYQSVNFLLFLFIVFRKKLRYQSGFKMHHQKPLKILNTWLI